MNEFARLADWQKEAVGSDDDLIAVALELSEVPTSPLHERHAVTEGSRRGERGVSGGG